MYSTVCLCSFIVYLTFSVYLTFTVRRLMMSTGSVLVESGRPVK